MTPFRMVSLLAAAALLAAVALMSTTAHAVVMAAILGTGAGAGGMAVLLRAQRRAVEAEARRRGHALAHTSEGVVLIGPDGLVGFVDPVAASALGSRVMVGRALHHPALRNATAEARATSGEVSDDLAVDGSVLRIQARQLEDDSVLILVSDPSEVERVDRLRRDFVANVSHELKTPVAGVRALAETAAAALAGHDLDTVERFLGQLHDETERLARLVTDLLDLSIVEAGHTFHPRSTDIDDLVREAVDACRPLAEMKGIALSSTPSNVTALVDSVQLRMAMKNLIDNGIRYSETGTVRVVVRAAEGSITIDVADQGMGIRSAEIPRLFERFYRIDKARSRVTGGTGLGLAIVRHVATNHGGDVQVTSEVGQGSTFTIVLPRHEGQ